MYTLVHVSPYCYIRFRVPEKGSLSNGHKFSPKDHVINTRILRKLMKLKESVLGSGLFPGLAVAALGHDGIVEAGS